jgi:CHAD domain-containing protein
MIWHDTPAGDLARQGLALAEQRGQWRLERLVPNGVADWLPATPTPVLAQAADLQSLGLQVPGGLMPVAGFTGKQRQFGLHDAQGAARLTLLEGALRGLTAEKPTCRLTLAGDKRAMAELAAALSADIQLTVPRAGLAEDASSLAQGRLPSPRHIGGPTVAANLTVEAALTLVCAHLTDVILHWAPLVRPESGPTPVHQMRVAVRRLRSALSIFRYATGTESWASLGPELKMLAARLGTARDWDVFLASTGAAVRQAFPHDARIASLLAAASRRRQASYAALVSRLADRPWQNLALTLALLPTRQPWAQSPTPEQAASLALPVRSYAVAALDRRLKHVFEPGKNLSALATAELHEVRKQAKRLRYAMEFFAPLFPGKATRRYLARLEDVQEALGSVNDGAVAAALMAELGGTGHDRAFASGVVQGFVAGGSGRRMDTVTQVWKKFLAAEPFWV